MKKTIVLRHIGVEHIRCAPNPLIDKMYMSLYKQLYASKDFTMCDIFTTIHLN
jgi:hypothetical protein